MPRSGHLRGEGTDEDWHEAERAEDEHEEGHGVLGEAEHGHLAFVVDRLLVEQTDERAARKPAAEGGGEEELAHSARFLSVDGGTV